MVLHKNIWGRGEAAGRGVAGGPTGWKTIVLGVTVAVLGAAGCSDDSSTTKAVCGNGFLEAGEQCDQGAENSDTIPNACRMNCQKPVCGDSVVDTQYAEQCDDGNTMDGDGCDAFCRLEENPLCGNGNLDAGEECDDGNKQDGDGCDRFCRSESVNCGNGNLDAGEECDDGNKQDGDGCSSSCHSEFCGDGIKQPSEECDDGTANSNTTPDACRVDCKNPKCGDGVTDTGEECDDGNNTAGDGCSAGCGFESDVCGNGVVDSGEECDDGNHANGDGCDSTCHLEAGACGNGVLEAGEQCDDGNAMDGDGCDHNCQLEGPVCGNGIVDSGEECDDGAANSDVTPDACRTNCMAAHCGDSIVDSGETCDDGNQSDGDGCDHNCAKELVQGCGNGVVETGEECDDGNVVACDGCSSTCRNETCGNGVTECAEGCDDGNRADGDGCDHNCTVETVTTCQPADQIGCGETKSTGTTATGSTDALNTYPCSPWNEDGREYAFRFDAPSASAIALTLGGLSANLDVFVVDGGNGSCDTTNCLTYGDDGAAFQSQAGHTYYVIVDGRNGAEGPFSLTLNCGVCGDGTVDPGEECDDGNTASGDGCSATCALESCGNGTTDQGEGCDDGNTVDCDGCSSTCQVEACGNGLVECAEECDDGNLANGDGCSSTCTIESATCTPAWDITCGDEDRWNTSYYGSTTDVDSYSCVSWDETGPEYVYTFQAPQTGQVTATLSGLESGVDLDVFVLDGGNGNGSCSAGSCIAYGNLSASFDAQAGHTYYVAVDGYDGAQGDFTMTMSCGGGICGDGVLNEGEECDDHNTVACDGCSATCAKEACGNGVLECAEECDDGNNTAGDGCSADCKNETGGCVAKYYLHCGADDDWNTTNAGSTDNVGQYSCYPAWDESGKEFTYWYYAYETRDATVTISYDDQTIDLDLFVLEDTGAGCGGEACIAYGDTEVAFHAEQGHYYYFVVDGYGGDEGAYHLTFDCAGGTPACGDGSLDPGEQCDDGNTAAGDGCSATCTIEDGTCNPVYTLHCGDSDSWSTTTYDNKVQEYGCTGLTESGPEYTYQFVAEATGEVNVTVTPVNPSDDLDVFVLLKQGASCMPGNCVEHGVSVGAENITFNALAGQTYYIVVDGYQGASGDYDVAVNCQ